MSYPIKIRVMRREFEPGKERVHDFAFDAEIVCEVPSKYNLFVNCLRQFGRCVSDCLLHHNLPEE